MNLSFLKNKNIHIIGITGLEGWAMLDFFLRQKFQKITGHDFSRKKNFKASFIKNHPGFSKREIEKALLRFSDYQKKIKIFFKEKYLQNIEDADIIFLPQSWFLYKENKKIFKLKDRIPLWGIVNLYFNFSPAKIIGVSGSQGKTTTCRLIGYIFKKAKRKFYYGGNDRKAVQCLSEILKMKEDDILVLEVSHRQLAFEIKRSPEIGIILNITRNHLDEVESFKKYQRLKEKLIKFQQKKDFTLLNFDDKIVKNFSKMTKGKVIFFSKDARLKEGIFFDKKDGYLKIKRGKKETKIIKREKIPLLGEHNLENILAAIGACILCKISPQKIKKGLETFPKIKNCLEYLKEKNGIKYWSDLASTTPEATIGAIRYLGGKKEKNLILIAGGEDKGMDYKNFGKEIQRNVNLLVLLPGSASEKIRQATSNKQQATKIEKVKTFEEAVKTTKEKSKRGDIVLLSPAAAFFQSKYGKRKDFLRLIF